MDDAAAGEHGVARGTVARGAALAVGFAVLYLLTAQGRLYGNDAAHFADWFAAGQVPASYHSPLYVRLAIGLAAWLPEGAEPLRPLWVVSAVAGAVGVAFVHAFVWRLGATAPAALAAAVLCGVTPVTWFFAATIETHALHFAAVAAAAWATLALPWGRPALATAGTACALAAVYLTHPTAPLLGPGFVLLAQHARARTGRRFGIAALAAVGAVLLGGLLLGHAANHGLRGRGFAIALGESSGAVGAFAGAPTLHNVVDTWLLPCGWLALLTVAAAFVGARPWRLPQAALWTAVLPSLGFFLWWGVPERGAYLLGSLPFAVALVACAFPLRSRRAVAAAALVVLLQAAFAGWTLWDFGRSMRIADRVARIEAAAGPRPLVLSASDNAPDVTLYLPDADELDVAALALQLPDEAVLAEQLVAHVRRALAGRRVVFDLSYRLRGGMRGLEHDIEALEAAIRGAFVVRDLDDPSWPLLVVERPR